MSTSSPGLWRRPDFLKVWAGQATSMFGSMVGGLAYSLVAIMVLNASPGQIAVLNGCSLIPGLAAGPWVGVWVDRLRHRPLLITADLGRAAALASIPVAAFTHTLTMPQLYAVAAVMSVLTMLFDVAFRAYTPRLVSSERLVEGNSILQGTAGAAEAGGFSVGGLLVQLVGAPLAVALDAVSFVLSALSLTAVRGQGAPGDTTERRADPSARHRRSWHEVAEGVRTLWQNPMLRALTATTFVWEMVGNVIGVVIMLFFVHDLHLAPAAMGPVFGTGGLSSLGGALVAGRLVRRWGLGRTLFGSLFLNNLGLLAVVVAAGPLPLVLTLLALGQATDAGRTIYEINVVSLLQSHAPETVLGRVFASYQTLRSAAMLLGLVVGGALGQTISLRAVLALALAANLLVPLCLLFSPLRATREPQPAAAQLPL